MAETNPKTTGNQDAQPNQEAPIQSLTRLSSLPFVKQTLQFTFSSYERIKSCNSLVNGGLTRVEQIGAGVLGNFKPVIGRFDHQIRVADEVFCTYLDQIEKRVPSLKSITPSAVIEQSVTKVTELRDDALQRVSAAKAFGISKVSGVVQLPIAQAVFRSVDTFIQLADNVVDTYLPPASDEVDSDSDTDSDSDDEHKLNTFQKIGNLANKIRKRVYKQAMDKFHHVQRLIL